jgi:DNA-binding NtrC family response regulator
MERDGSIAALLRPTAQTHGWWIREVRQASSCLNLLRQSGPTVLVLVIGKQPETEMTLLERVTLLAPNCHTVAIIESADARLAHLAWDLGAAYVFLPMQLHQMLEDVVVGLMPGD